MNGIELYPKAEFDDPVHEYRDDLPKAELLAPD